MCPQVTPLTNTNEEPLYFKSEILENAQKNLKKNSQKSYTHRSITPPNDLLISCIVFKWQLFENLNWRVNVIDRKERMNESCQTYK